MRSTDVVSIEKSAIPQMVSRPWTQQLNLIGTMSVLTWTPGVSRPVNKSTTVPIVVVVVSLAVRPSEAQTVIVLVRAVPVIAAVVTTSILTRLASSCSPLCLSSLRLSAFSAAALLVEIYLAVLEILFSFLALQLGVCRLQFVLLTEVAVHA